MADLMQTIVKYALETKYEDLPTEAVDYAKKSILDAMGCAIAGSSTDTVREIVELVKEWGGKEESTILVYGGRVPAMNAALAIGPMVRCSELGDVLESPHGAHPTSYIFPAVVPAAELRGNVTGKEFITAVTIAQDLTYRFVAARKGMNGKPFRPGASIYFAVTAGVARLLGLDEDTAWNAMGIILGEAASEGQSIREGKLMISMSHGIMASECIRSAILAQRGITGPREVLQGECGYYNVHEPEHDLSALTFQLGKVFKGPQTSTKIWPSCRIGHSIMDATLDIVTEFDIKPGDVEKIEIDVTPYSFGFICLPEEDKSSPKTRLNAMFSAAYMVAITIIKRMAWMEDFTEEAIKSPEVHELLRITKTKADPKLMAPDMPFGGRVTIKTRDGKKHTKEVIYPLGHPKNPLNMNMIVNKFRKCLPYSIKPFKESNVDRIIGMVSNLEEVDDVTRLFELLVP